MPTDSITPEGRAINARRRPQDRARSGGAPSRDGKAPRVRPDSNLPDSNLNGPPDADVGAPAQPPMDERAKTVRPRPPDPPRQGEGHDERGEYGRGARPYDAPEDYGDIKDQR